jgi:hypothetical protein
MSEEYRAFTKSLDDVSGGAYHNVCTGDLEHHLSAKLISCFNEQMSVDEISRIHSSTLGYLYSQCMSVFDAMSGRSNDLLRTLSAGEKQDFLPEFRERVNRQIHKINRAAECLCKHNRIFFSDVLNNSCNSLASFSIISKVLEDIENLLR